MKVCNICLGPPTYTGMPQVEDDAGNKKYLFGSEWATARVDFCETCLENMRVGRWDKIAESAHAVLLVRLGVVPNERADDTS